MRLSSCDCAAALAPTGLAEPRGGGASRLPGLNALELRLVILGARSARVVPQIAQRRAGLPVHDDFC
jgi:hypothetical protein